MMSLACVVESILQAVSCEEAELPSCELEKSEHLHPAFNML